MPKLMLKFGDRVIREYALEEAVTIGRLPDNVVVIDNPAVSGHHARVFLDGDRFVVEDLRSKNGTYVNEQHVVRALLNTGDVLLIGKHKIVFDEADGTGNIPSDRAAPTLGATAYLDTKQHRAMLARLREARAAREKAAPAKAPGSPADGAVLRVLGGAAQQREYRLEAQTSVIGKSEAALVRLRGWFKPQVAAAIVREADAYFLTPTAGETLVNGGRLESRRALRDGDLLDVCGLVFEFRLDGRSRASHSHPHVA